MFMYLVDVVALSFTVVWVEKDGSVRLMDGSFVHMDALRSDRVYLLHAIPAKKDASKFPYAMYSTPLTSLVPTDVPIQMLP